MLGSFCSALHQEEEAVWAVSGVIPTVERGTTHLRVAGVRPEESNSIRDHLAFLCRGQVGSGDFATGCRRRPAGRQSRLT
jgi:hypothetical protein